MLHKDLLDYLENNRRIQVTFSCSPKLSVSGESWNDAIKPKVASQYASVTNSDLYLKFVVADKDDVDEVSKAVEAYREAGVECSVYLMPLGGRSEEYNMNVKEVAEICKKYNPKVTLRETNDEIPNLGFSLSNEKILKTGFGEIIPQLGLEQKKKVKAEVLTKHKKK